MTTTTRHAYPADRAEKRRVLLDKVESIREVVTRHADDAERLETLAPEVVEALQASGLWGLKLPAEVGGAEADPVTQLEVIEAVTYMDTSAGWAVMIGATSIGWPGAYLPDAGVARVFANGRIPTAAGIGGVSGTAKQVEGGYRVSGRFLFGSGARHAEWMLAGAPILGADGEPASARTFVVPVEQTTLHLDSWHVAGLRGTGSCDFSLDDVFVPEEMSWDRSIMARGLPERGGAIFRLGMPAFTANEHAAFSLGAGRRALDLVIEQAKSKRRGTGAAVMTIADRPVFQAFVARSDLRLKAARAHELLVLEKAWQTACNGETPGPELQAELRASGVYVTEVACDIAAEAFRYAGGSALQSSNLLQRYWRDVNGGAQHLAVSNAGYEAYGQFLLGYSAADPGFTGVNARA